MINSLLVLAIIAPAIFAANVEIEKNEHSLVYGKLFQNSSVSWHDEKILLRETGQMSGLSHGKTLIEAVDLRSICQKISARFLQQQLKSQPIRFCYRCILDKIYIIRSLP
ncbi:hypothetical protein [Undibacterium umbellatum]|uniref:Uncharacterized protein n=1 Tax=Undibacterium umbellatum TaxID=2762300 RepID=A0ABR6ZDZ5_9BURK|nr:hypothetical protein [Undibacterium umbellatum]MBC3909586.1 hypothetical protein [Undibacterium umbellatum]